MTAVAAIPPMKKFETSSSHKLQFGHVHSLAWMSHKQNASLTGKHRTSLKFSCGERMRDARVTTHEPNEHLKAT